MQVFPHVLLAELPPPHFSYGILWSSPFSASVYAGMPIFFVDYNQGMAAKSTAPAIVQSIKSFLTLEVHHQGDASFKPLSS